MADEGVWRQEGESLVRDYKFEDFAEAMAFVNRVAELAEAADHHPDIDIRYNKVSIALSTHSEGGITEKDFALAEQIDEAVNRMVAREIDDPVE